MPVPPREQAGGGVGGEPVEAGAEATLPVSHGMGWPAFNASISASVSSGRPSRFRQACSIAMSELLSCFLGQGGRCPSRPFTTLLGESSAICTCPPTVLDPKKSLHHADKTHHHRMRPSHLFKRPEKYSTLKTLDGALHTDRGRCMLSVGREVKTVRVWGSLPQTQKVTAAAGQSTFTFRRSSGLGHGNSESSGNGARAPNG
jgi:hypothetical protein